MVKHIVFHFLFPDKAPTGKSLEIGVPRNLDIQLEYLRNNLLEISSSKLTEQISKEQLNLNRESPSFKPKYEHCTLTGVVTTTTQFQMDSKEFEAPNRNSKISDINNKATNDTKALPSLELSLKRPQGVKDTGTEVQDDQYILRHSDLSAFSRYEEIGSKFSIVVIMESENNCVIKPKGYLLIVSVIDVLPMSVQVQSQLKY